ncbi:MAG: hypothetical protein MJ211_05740 [Bacteroidales bacterium]|nr:hypothetical protein [Bacteroidales bacterium]
MRKLFCFISFLALILLSCDTSNLENSEKSQGPSSQIVADSSTIVVAEVQKVVAYFNSAHYLLSQDFFSWNKNLSDWVISSQQKSSYNSKGLLVMKEFLFPSVFSKGNLIPLERDSFFYNNEKDTLQIIGYIYSEGNNNWIQVSKNIYQYKLHKRISETKLSWDYSEKIWNTVLYKSLNYDENGRLSLIKTISPDRNDTAQKYISECEILYLENGFEKQRNYYSIIDGKRILKPEIL